MNEDYLPYLSWLEYQDLVPQLVNLCNINSGSYNIEGNMKVAQILTDIASDLPAKASMIAVPKINTISMQGKNEKQQLGDVLTFSKELDSAQKRVLLCGHRDTVFGLEHPFQRVRWQNDTVLNGPGVSDMKGGLLVMLYALKAFERSPWATALDWRVLINADEELGSPASAAIFESYATRYDFGLVFEPSMTPEGALASARKGSAKYTLVAHGKAAHAGRNFDKGKNAICYLAKVITAIDALNGERKGVTINIGLIQGGQALNMVPDIAVAKIDIRIDNPKDQAWIEEKFADVMLQFNKHSDFRLEVDGYFGRKPKLFNEKTQLLFKQVKQSANSLALDINWMKSGGCCDGNNLAAQGLPVVDTLGVRGGKIHTSEEFLIVNSLVERAKLTALLLMKYARGEFDLKEANHDAV